MEKWLTLGSLIVCCLVLAVFLMDLILGFPFHRTIVLDVCAILAAGLIALLSWEVYREIT
ncbi:MAG: hypothetical protein RMJ19_09155 [Gemmatales bacterium]|nr:hypothetical protein [Gemmatales bacterium]MCS7160626.1 hypothetical protein [Gemmatales bacterium]MDW8175827.1 hypothetical protein [Gemmatales bacterium]MDW8221951.1 hypothetical protein [Gemmatales bacterium]